LEAVFKIGKETAREWRVGKGRGRKRRSPGHNGNSLYRLYS